MKIVNMYLQKLTHTFSLVDKLPTLDAEDKFWLLTKMKHTINWVRKELGYEPLRFRKGTFEIINE